MSSRSASKSSSAARGQAKTKKGPALLLGKVLKTLHVFLSKFDPSLLQTIAKQLSINLSRPLYDSELPDAISEALSVIAVEEFVLFFLMLQKGSVPKNLIPDDPMNDLDASSLMEIIASLLGISVKTPTQPFGVSEAEIAFSALPIEEKLLLALLDPASGGIPGIMNRCKKKELDAFWRCLLTRTFPSSPVPSCASNFLTSLLLSDPSPPSPTSSSSSNSRHQSNTSPHGQLLPLSGPREFCRHCCQTVNAVSGAQGGAGFETTKLSASVSGVTIDCHLTGGNNLFSSNTGKRKRKASMLPRMALAKDVREGVLCEIELRGIRTVLMDYLSLDALCLICQQVALLHTNNDLVLASNILPSLVSNILQSKSTFPTPSASRSSFGFDDSRPEQGFEFVESEPNCPCFSHLKASIVDWFLTNVFLNPLVFEFGQEISNESLDNLLVLSTVFPAPSPPTHKTQSRSTNNSNSSRFPISPIIIPSSRSVPFTIPAKDYTFPPDPPLDRSPRPRSHSRPKTAKDSISHLHSSSSSSKSSSSFSEDDSVLSSPRSRKGSSSSVSTTTPRRSHKKGVNVPASPTHPSPEHKEETGSSSRKRGDTSHDNKKHRRRDRDEDDEDHEQDEDEEQEDDDNDDEEEQEAGEEDGEEDEESSSSTPSSSASSSSRSKRKKSSRKKVKYTFEDEDDGYTPKSKGGSSKNKLYPSVVGSREKFHLIKEGITEQELLNEFNDADLKLFCKDLRLPITVRDKKQSKASKIIEYLRQKSRGEYVPAPPKGRGRSTYGPPFSMSPSLSSSFPPSLSPFSSSSPSLFASGPLVSVGPSQGMSGFSASPSSGHKRFSRSPSMGSFSLETSPPTTKLPRSQDLPYLSFL